MLEVTPLAAGALTLGERVANTPAPLTLIYIHTYIGIIDR